MSVGQPEAVYSLPLCLSTLLSGSGPCVGEASQPEEQTGEQAGEHRSEEDTHGTPVRGSGTGTGGWILDKRGLGGVQGWGKVGHHSRETARELDTMLGRFEIGKG